MLNLYYSKTVNGCSEKMFNSLKQNRGKGVNQIIFTPDRMTLQIEEELFDVLGEQCFFDVDVTTLTRFTNKIISNNNICFKVLTKPVCVALIKKILNENKNDLQTMKKAISFNGFASTLFDTISMFKSCNVTPEQLEYTTKNKNLNLKLSDLKLVYKKYEDFLQNEYTDSFNKLNLLVNLIKGCNFKNTHFYFVGFSDFTPQMYNVICELIKNSASVNVACAVGFIDELNNKNIYLNNVYLSLLDLCNVYGFSYNKIYCKSVLQPEFNVVSNNLFALKPVVSNLESKNIELYKFNNALDEATFAIKKMQWLIINEGYSYNDFVIITSNLSDYKSKLEYLFLENNIPYFFDESEPISNSVVLRFYFDLFELINGNFNKRDLLNFLRAYSSINEQILNSFDNMVEKSGYNYFGLLKPIKHLYTQELEPVYLELNKFVKLIKDLSETKNFGMVLSVITNFANEFGFNNYINTLSETYKQKNNVLEYNKLNNVVNKVNKGFGELEQVLCSYETDLPDVFSIIKAYFENITVVMPPILSDSVLVTDIIKGELPNKKYALFLGCQEGKMPAVQNDLGLITDQDINLLSESFKLNPTVNQINKRNKFKVFESFLKFNKICVGYVAVTASGEKIMPSEVINNLQMLFPNLKVVNGSVLQHGYQTEFTNNYFLFNNTNPNFAKSNLIENLKLQQTDNSAVLLSNSSSLYSALEESVENVKTFVDNLTFVNNVPNLTTPNLFLTKGDVSVSEIESYYACPFKHFVSYGLKLAEQETSEIKANEYGNILHEYVKEIVPYIRRNQDLSNLSEFSINTLDQILTKKQYEHLVLSPTNKNDIKSLQKEIFRINEALIRLNASSSLNPLWLEHGFKGFEVGNADVKIGLKGVIDRVDFADNSFTIIDYKTGGTEFKDFSDIASGKKLQLIIYAYIVSKKTGKTPIGTFYMPLKNEYSKVSGEELYKLKGVVSNNISDILQIDKNLSEPNVSSLVLNLKTKKDGGITGKILVSPQDFDKLVNYAISMVLLAVKNINAGVITPNPLKGGNHSTCDYCQYLGMCKFCEKHGNKFNEIKNIKTVEELEN